MNNFYFGSNAKKTASKGWSKLCFISLFFYFSATYSQVADSTKVNQLDAVLVSATKIDNKTPMTFSDFTKKEIEKRNLGQDIPILMNFLPSVVTTSDAGNGFGYTGIRVRGSDATRVNVTINGIPYNDSEYSGTYFVDMPDFASSLSSIQLQRGVGTSTNGSGAFGASLNLVTQEVQKQASGEINNSFGSFNSRKNTVKFSTGLLNNQFEISGRLSVLHSDGYVDRASSDLKSYFLQGTFVGKTTLIKALVFGGYERTYQAWTGVDAETLASNRTFNINGMYTDANGNTQFYKNQVDNYNQDHYQLHWNEKMNDNFHTNLAFHYTKGKGYYEEYNQAQDFSAYGLTPINIAGTVIDKTDLVRRKWLDNDFYGITFSGNYAVKDVELITGGSYNRYEGKHFGEVIWAQYASNLQNTDHYYDYFGNKNDLNLFSKINYLISKKLSVYGDLQYRLVNYQANGVYDNEVSQNFRFLNPKGGLTYSWTKKQQLYFSYAKANREPNRTDFEAGSPRPEKLDDYELGWRYAGTKTQLSINGYAMIYHDQLVLTGALDDVGNPIRKNAGESYRIGVEVEAGFKIGTKLSIKPNIAVSENKNKNYFSPEASDLINKGNTTIAYSPKLIAGNIITVQPINGLQLNWLSKFVGSQYLSNIEDENAVLKDYFIQDFNLIYEFKPKKVFQSIAFTGLVNNVFDKKYVSNGNDYGGGYVYYFPQAGINFLVGLNLKF